MINQVMVCVNNIQDRPSAVHAACLFASSHKARLSAIHIKLDTVQIVNWSGTTPLDIADQMLIDQAEHEQQAKDKFAEIVTSYGCQHHWQTVYQSDNPYRQMLCSDAIFVDQPLQKEPSNYTSSSFVNELILQSKRPIVVIPDKWQRDKFASNILLGWNETAEAMRAAVDALPIMRAAERVEILKIVTQPTLGDAPNAHPDISAYLEGKGIKNNLAIEAGAKHQNQQFEILKYADRSNVDLLVVGGYGHSRIREAVMGGVSKHLINHSPIPVLLSH